MTTSYDVDAYVAELRARITELEAELAHERTLRRASTAGGGRKPGSWKSQFLAVVARAERVEAAWQDSEKHVIEIAERLTREQARAEKAEKTSAEWQAIAEQRTEAWQKAEKAFDEEQTHCTKMMAAASDKLAELERWQKGELELRRERQARERRKAE